jgi:hypothetical protein
MDDSFSEFGAEVAKTIKAVDSRCAALEAKISRLEGALESAALMKYLGVFKEGRIYNEGSVTTFDGAMWHANQKTGTPPGNGNAAWTLCVKGGAR